MGAIRREVKRLFSDFAVNQASGKSRLIPCGVVAAGLWAACLSHTMAAEQQPVSYLQVPLSFESDHLVVGDANAFVSTVSGFRLTLLPQEALLESIAPVHAPQSESRGSAIHLRLLGANPQSQLAGLEQLPARSFHLEGRDPQLWRTAKNFARVRYRAVYPGVDLVYYGNQNQLEYDFVVAPQAHAEQIRFAVSGARAMHVDAVGSLILATGNGEISLGKPRVYQQAGQSRRLLTRISACRAPLSVLM